MQNKHKIIIISLILISIAVIIFIYVQFVHKSEKKSKHLHIEFLNINDKKADSVLNSLSVDDLLDKLFIANDDSSSIFQLITAQNYLDAINDSSAIIKILQNDIKDNKKFIFFNLNNHEINNFQDSSYINFITKKYNYYKKIINCCALCGFKLDSTQIYNLVKPSLSNNLAPKLYKNITTQADFIYIDSSVNISKNLQVDGILAAQLKPNLNTNNQILTILKTNIDLFRTDKENIPFIKQKIKTLIANKEYSETQLKQKLRKLIKAEIWLQQQKKYVDTTKISSKKSLAEYMVEKSICAMNNEDTILPVSNKIYNKKLLIIYLGKRINKQFKKNIKHYIDAEYAVVNTDWQAKSLRKYKKYNTFLLLDKSLKDSVLSQLFSKILKYGVRENSVVINIANLENLEQIPDSLPCLQTQGSSKYDYQLAAQAIFGGIEISGILPYYMDANYQFGIGNKSPKTRLQYTTPKNAGLNAKKLSVIDKIALEGIRRGAFPACQIFVARQGKVVYNKSFGYHTYAQKQRVENNDIFDLASVTKIAATTMACMKMNSDKTLMLSDKLSHFFQDTSIDYTRIKADTLIKIDTFDINSITDWTKFLKHNDTLNIGDSLFIIADTTISKLTPKRNIFQVPLENLLKHKSGLSPAVPIFKYMCYKTFFLKYLEQKDSFNNILKYVHYREYDVSNDFPDNTNLPDSVKMRIIQGFEQSYDKYFTENYIKDTAEIQLTKNQYFKQEYFDTIWRDIKQIPVYSNKVFQYSDLNMVLLQMAMDSINGMNIDKFLKREIYQPLGLKNITFRPLINSKYSKIVPTEIAENWRRGLLKGFVHDPSSALLGGIAGNAGLFANAHDLGVLFQMILNKGNYGGQQFIKPEIVTKFTTRHEDIQRALGFDMPNRKAVVGSKASKNSFGHSGYTGTCIWIDPDNQLVYVFLSNRNHPSSKNWKIVNYKIRERIHNAIYDAISNEQ